MQLIGTTIAASGIYTQCRKKAESIAMGRLLRLHCDRHCAAIDYLSDHSNGRFRLSMDSQWALQGLLLALTIVCTITLQQ